MSLVLNVEILGEFKKLTSATQGAQSTLGKLDDRIGGFASSAKRAFASIGVGLSFAFLARELTEATKAAVEDRKSQGLLAQQLETTMGANDAQIASVEKSIAAFQRSAAVADDELRPAYSKLILATKDYDQSNRLMSIALDASAGTGKNLDQVVMAMTKSLAGSDTALMKLIPSLKGSKTPIDDLAMAFAGASDKAANLDPYARMNVMFDDIKENIGTALLPALDKFSTWMASPKGEETIQKVTDAVTEMVTWLGNAATWAMENGDWLAPLVGGIAAVAGAWKLVTTAVNATKAAIALATAAQIAFNKVTGGTGTVPTVPGSKTPTTKLPSGNSSLGKIIGGVSTLATVLSIPGSSQLYGNAAQPSPLYSNGKLIGYRMPDGTVQGVGGAYSTGAPSIVNNVTVNNNTGTLTGSDLTALLNKFSSDTGTVR
jgi:hypothetical protein